MSKYRNKIEIIAAILEASCSGSSKTHIMSQANLSFKNLGVYLKLALDNGFLVNNGVVYELSKSGQDFLSRYRKFNQKYSTIQESQRELEREYEALERLCTKLEPAQKCY